ncbi:hypothetical protein B0H21DRAFT_97880 [Amylocystis lapponica]|nr:hypothetical protein B0H21DRAFT_97880 [Amylocystis lapponica]
MSSQPFSVHFGDTTYRVFIPPTPPASRASGSSWGSPPLIPHTPFIRPIPLPESPRTPFKPMSSPRTSTTTAIHIHPFLSTSPDGRCAKLWWDLKQPMETARLFGEDAKWHPLSRAQLSAAATHPPRSELTLRVPGYPWAVTVSPRAPTACVTVLDVLYHIHRNLHKGVRVDEGRTGTRALRASVRRAYTARVDAVVDAKAREAEKRKGMRRIDYLLGKDVFDGLRLERGEGEAWTLEMRASSSSSEGMW